MSILRCPQCNGAVLSVASRCPHCTVLLPFAHDAMQASSRRAPADAPRRAVMPIVATCIVGALVIGGALTQSAPSEAPPAAPPSAVVAPRAAPLVASTPASPPNVSPAIAEEGDTPVITPMPEPRRSSDRRRPMVASQWVNLRYAPSRSAEVLVVVPPQALVQADSAAPGWRRVTYEGAVGWVAEQHLVRQDQR